LLRLCRLLTRGPRDGIKSCLVWSWTDDEWLILLRVLILARLFESDETVDRRIVESILKRWNWLEYRNIFHLIDSYREETDTNLTVKKNWSIIVCFNKKYWILVWKFIDCQWRFISKMTHFDGFWRHCTDSFFETLNSKSWIRNSSSRDERTRETHAQTLMLRE